MSPRLSSFLDVSRWLAAFVVAFSHVRHVMLVDYHDATSANLIAKIFYFLGGLGHEAVMVFFVVSGYLVGGLTFVRRKTRGFSLAEYATHRFSRIYTVLAPALVVGGLLDLAGLTFFNGTQLYTGASPYHINSLLYNVSDNLNLATFLGNLAMMQGVLTSHLGSNGGLWSLSFEWWYYCIFAAAMLLMSAPTRAGKILSGAALVAMCVLLPLNMIALGLVWLMGVAIAAYGETKFWRPPVLLGLLAFAVALTLSRLDTSNKGDMSQLDSLTRDLSVGGGYALLLLSLCKPGPALPLAKVHAALANFSYSLYLVHFPMMLLAVCALHDLIGFPLQRQPTAATLAIIAALLGFLYLYAWAFYAVTEAHTQKIRNWLLRGWRALEPSAAK